MRKELFILDTAVKIYDKSSTLGEFIDGDFQYFNSEADSLLDLFIEMMEEKKIKLSYDDIFAYLGGDISWDDLIDTGKKTYMLTQGTEE